jgi:hypothetical protein
LYRQYRFDEPWDSPHNRAVAGGLPIGMSGVYPMYHCASDRDSDPLDTSYVTIVGRDAYSPGPMGRKLEELTRGTSNTIAIAEMAESGIPWMAPRDLSFDTMSFKINDRSGVGIRSKHSGGACVAMADGSTRGLAKDTDPEVVKNLCKVSDREDPSSPGSR